MGTTTKVENFKQALRAYCEPYRISVIKHRGSRRTVNLMGMVSKDKGQRTIRVLYVKHRSSGEGFWGLTENQMRALQRQGHKWDVVLLVGSGERNYRGTSQQIQNGSYGWSSSAGDYKVHESEIKGLFTRFDSYAALFSDLLSPAAGI